MCFGNPGSDHLIHVDNGTAGDVYCEHCVTVLTRYEGQCLDFIPWNPAAHPMWRKTASCCLEGCDLPTTTKCGWRDCLCQLCDNHGVQVSAHKTICYCHRQAPTAQGGAPAASSRGPYAPPPPPPPARSRGSGRAPRAGLASLALMSLCLLCTPPPATAAPSKSKGQTKGQTVGTWFRAPRVRDQKRGPQAWDNVQKDLSQVPFKLLAHAVADDTGLERYLREIQHFLDFVKQERPPFGDWTAVDWALCHYLGVCCYVRDWHFARGEHLLNGMLYLYPDHAFKNAWQGLKAWKRITVDNPGGPLPDQMLAVMEDELRAHPDQAAQVAGRMIPVAVDGYCREGDLLQLRAEDITCLDQDVVLHFGRRSRGESTKTGREQGVRLDTPHAQDVVRARLASCKPRERLFPITAKDYQKWWWWACTKVGGTRPPHAARHSGPARDLATGYRTLAQVQRRGRWLSEKSVLRYTKTHEWVAVNAELRADIRQRGDELLAKRQPRPDLARD